MSFYKELQDLHLSFSSIYYDNSLANNYEIKELIDNQVSISTLWKKYPITGITCIDDYLNLLFAQKVTCFESILNELTIDDIKRKKLEGLISQAKCLISMPESINKDIISFIGVNYKDLLCKRIEPYGLSDIDEATIDFILKFKNGIDPAVIKYVFQNLGSIVIRRFQEFEPLLIKNDSLFEDLFPDLKLECVKQIGFENSLFALSRMISKEDTSLSKKAEKMVSALTEDILNLYEILTPDNVLVYEQVIRQYITFLCRLSHVDANKFVKVKAGLENLVNESIRINGKTITIPISLDSTIEFLSSDRPILNRIVPITHDVDKDTKVINAKLNVPPTTQIATDMASTTIPVNNYFTFSHQIKLDSLITSGAIISDTIFSDEKLAHEYAQGVNSIISFIASQTHVDSEELISDFSLLFQMLAVVYYSTKDSDEMVMNALCYGPAVFICALSEKLLRYCYFEEAKEYKYVPLNKATIGTLLDSNNTEMKTVLGEYQIKHLNYFLGQDKDGLVGLSYRNRLAHWNEISCNFLKPHFLCELFFLLLSIINSIYLYYKNKQDDLSKDSSLGDASKSS